MPQWINKRGAFWDQGDGTARGTLRIAVDVTGQYGKEVEKATLTLEFKNCYYKSNQWKKEDTHPDFVIDQQVFSEEEDEAYAAKQNAQTEIKDNIPFENK